MSATTSLTSITSVEVVTPKNGRPYAVATIPSTSSDRSYRVDLVNGRCSCPGWVFSKPAPGKKRMCKHLRALGFKDE